MTTLSMDGERDDEDDADIDLLREPMDADLTAEVPLDGSALGSSISVIVIPDADSQPEPPSKKFDEEWVVEIPVDEHFYRAIANRGPGLKIQPPHRWKEAEWTLLFKFDADSSHIGWFFGSDDLSATPSLFQVDCTFGLFILDKDKKNALWKSKILNKTFYHQGRADREDYGEFHDLSAEKFAKIIEHYQGGIVGRGLTEAAAKEEETKDEGEGEDMVVVEEKADADVPAAAAAGEKPSTEASAFLPVTVFIKISCCSLFRPAFVGNSWDSKKETGMVGLKNLGATCYLNALLQMLYHVGDFRRAVYKLPHQGEILRTSTTLCMQNLFQLLHTSSTREGVSTKELTTAFGWTSADAFTQQDVQEMMRVLLDKLEEKMKGTCVDGKIKDLFAGTTRSFVSCINIEYESKREEDFYDIQLGVKGCKDIYESFEKYTELEQLNGENQYDAGEHGKQDANKGIIFAKFPPVLTIHLKRFEYDCERMGNRKVHDHFAFPARLELDRFLAPDAPEESKSQPNTYLLHSVLVHSGDSGGGHYYAYIRPSKFDYEGEASSQRSARPEESESKREESSRNGPWYKFDDEHVYGVDAQEAIDYNYGRSGVEGGINNTWASAYMLVYIREAEAGQIMREVHDSDIPSDLSERLVRERKLREFQNTLYLAKRERRKVEYFTEHQIRAFRPSKNVTRLQDFVAKETTTDLTITFSKCTFLSLLLKIAESMSKKSGTFVNPASLRLWKSYRYNNGGTAYHVSGSVKLDELDQPEPDRDMDYLDIFVQELCAPDYPIQGMDDSVTPPRPVADIEFELLLARESAWLEKVHIDLIESRGFVLTEGEADLPKELLEHSRVGDGYVLRSCSQARAKMLLEEMLNIQKDMIECIERHQLAVGEEKTLIFFKAFDPCLLLTNTQSSSLLAMDVDDADKTSSAPVPLFRYEAEYLPEQYKYLGMALINRDDKSTVLLDKAVEFITRIYQELPSAPHVHEIWQRAENYYLTTQNSLGGKLEVLHLMRDDEHVPVSEVYSEDTPNALSHGSIITFDPNLPVYTKKLKAVIEDLDRTYLKFTSYPLWRRKMGSRTFVKFEPKLESDTKYLNAFERRKTRKTATTGSKRQRQALSSNEESSEEGEGEEEEGDSSGIEDALSTASAISFSEDEMKTLANKYSFELCLSIDDDMHDVAEAVSKRLFNIDMKKLGFFFVFKNGKDEELPPFLGLKSNGDASKKLSKLMVGKLEAICFCIYPFPLIEEKKGTREITYEEAKGVFRFEIHVSDERVKRWYHLYKKLASSSSSDGGDQEEVQHQSKRLRGDQQEQTTNSGGQGAFQDATSNFSRLFEMERFAEEPKWSIDPKAMTCQDPYFRSLTPDVIYIEITDDLYFSHLAEEARLSLYLPDNISAVLGEEYALPDLDGGSDDEDELFLTNRYHFLITENGYEGVINSRKGPLFEGTKGFALAIYEISDGYVSMIIGFNHSPEDYYSSWPQGVREDDASSYALQHISPQDHVHMLAENREPGHRSMMITVCFCQRKTRLRMRTIEYDDAPPFFSYVKENDTYETLEARLREITGDNLNDESILTSLTPKNDALFFEFLSRETPMLIDEPNQEGTEVVVAADSAGQMELTSEGAPPSNSSESTAPTVKTPYQVFAEHNVRYANHCFEEARSRGWNKEKKLMHHRYPMCGIVHNEKSFLEMDKSSSEKKQTVRRTNQIKIA